MISFPPSNLSRLSWQYNYISKHHNPFIIICSPGIPLPSHTSRRRCPIGLKEESSKYDTFNVNILTYRQALSSLITRHESVIHRTKQQRLISPLMDQFRHSRLTRLTRLTRYMDDKNKLSDLGNLTTYDYLLSSEDWQSLSISSVINQSFR